MPVFTIWLWIANVRTFNTFWISLDIKHCTKILSIFNSSIHEERRFFVDNFLFWWESFGISKIIFFQWLLHASKITSRRKLILLACKRNLSQVERWPQTLPLRTIITTSKIRKNSGLPTMIMQLASLHRGKDLCLFFGIWEVGGSGEGA